MSTPHSDPDFTADFESQNGFESFVTRYAPNLNAWSKKPPRRSMLARPARLNMRTGSARSRMAAGQAASSTSKRGWAVGKKKKSMMVISNPKHARHIYAEYMDFRPLRARLIPSSIITSLAFLIFFGIGW